MLWNQTSVGAFGNNNNIETSKSSQKRKAAVPIKNMIISPNLVKRPSAVQKMSNTSSLIKLDTNQNSVEAQNQQVLNNLMKFCRKPS